MLKNIEKMKINKDRQYLDKAVKLAFKGIDLGGGPFGAVIVRDNIIISQSYNMVVLRKDPTAHAEILAIREAATLLGTHCLSDCILYTSCEPCPMCLGAIYWAGIKRVVYACDRHDAENAGFSDSFIYNEICLDPAKRHVVFNHEGMLKATEVFSKWEKSENKVQY